MVLLRASVVVVALLLLAPAGAGAINRQGAPLRVAGGDLLATTGSGNERLRRVDPKTLASTGRQIRMPDEERDPQVSVRARGRRIIVTTPARRGDGTRLTVTTYAASTMRRVARRTIDIELSQIDEMLQVGDRRLAFVQGFGLRPQEPPRLVVVDPVGGKVVRTVTLADRLEDVRLLGTRIGFLLRAGDGALRLEHYSADGRLERAVPLPVAAVPRPDPETGDRVAGLRYAGGRGVALYRSAAEQVTVAQVDLRTGAVDSRTLDRVAAGLTVPTPAFRVDAAAELVRVNGSTVDLVLTYNDASPPALISVASDGSPTRVRRLPEATITVAGEDLLLQSTRLSVYDAAGRERWSVRSPAWDLYPDVALLGDRVVQREDDGDPVAAIRSARTGKLLGRHEDSFSLLRQLTGRPVGDYASPGDSVFTAIASDLF